MTKTRIAPSPTGPLHIGTARTALYSWLFAKKHDGSFILRIEDTDKERSEKEFEEDIIEGLSWLGLDWDETHKQSERLAIYKNKAEKLIKEGKAYREGDAVILKKNKDKISFKDSIRGIIEFDSSELKDPVIMKSDGTPTYNFAVVVDDNEMGITNVIRGEDHIPNTAVHLTVAKALEVDPPKYAHLPLILGADRSKLSKRHGATSVNEYRKRGYIADAMINFMALLGWNPGDEREIFSRKDLVKEFSLERVHRGGAIFNTEKLDWMNQQYIKKMSREELKLRLEEYTGKNLTEALVAIAQPRLAKLSDISEDFSLLEDVADYEKESLVWKKTSLKKTKENLEAVVSLLESIEDKEFNQKKIEDKIMPVAEERGRGEVLWPMRVALSGKEKSPGPFELAELVGKKETIVRIKRGINKIK